MELVILTDQDDNAIGEMEKMEAHKAGLLHRAFSVIVFNSQNQMLLQQRAAVKYHSPMLWTNTCCGHPRPNENTIDAAKRRLMEENGFTCNLAHAFTFQYQAAFDNGLIENEIDHVFIGNYNGPVPFNPAEAEAVKWVSLDEVESLIANNPDNFTVWFKILFPQLKKHYADKA